MRATSPARRPRAAESRSASVASARCTPTQRSTASSTGACSSDQQSSPGACSTSVRPAGGSAASTFVTSSRIDRGHRGEHDRLGRLPRVDHLEPGRAVGGRDPMDAREVPGLHLDRADPSAADRAPPARRRPSAGRRPVRRAGVRGPAVVRRGDRGELVGSTGSQPGIVQRRRLADLDVVGHQPAGRELPADARRPAGARSPECRAARRGARSPARRRPTTGSRRERRELPSQSSRLTRPDGSSGCPRASLSARARRASDDRTGTGAGSELGLAATSRPTRGRGSTSRWPGSSGPA